MKVLVTDSISSEGIDILRQAAEVDVKLGIKTDELINIIGDYQGLVVRSQTQVTAPVIAAGKNLIVIGRAGAGVDNIDVEAATKHGILVVNAPGGNTISAAEHTIALMLALARHIPQASASLKGGKWRRNDFMGIEVRDKTLGIIGLGRIGTEVAKRAQGLQMKVLAHDPFIASDRAKSLQVELVALEEIFQKADFITLHVPMTAETKEIIGEKELALVKPGVRIINCARGGLINDDALAAALREKRVAGAAIDVFATEPTTESIFFGMDNVIVTPHLGASTTEAQATSATDVAVQMVAIFKGQPATYAVNAPLIPPETASLLAPFVPLCTTLGRLVRQLADGQMNAIKIQYQGEISGHDTNALKAAILGGLLEGISEERVNLVNANMIASQRGLSVVEQKEAGCVNYASLITVEVTTSKGQTAAAGTVLRDEAHLVRVGGYWLDIVPAPGYFLFAEHRDRPGLIGAVGKITGDADINISAMQTGRLKPRGEAMMMLALDEPLTEAHLKKIKALGDVYSAKIVKL
ncbi:MAG: phosphoglycerate dehydrogenase [Dehalococcoidia bacterium]|nr:MAG: phosphoglycerate dehydrogenase [Dehalococcoidia bacterium]